MTCAGSGEADPMKACLALLAAFLLALAAGNAAAEDWPQLKFDSRHSGNAPDHKLSTPLGLVAAVPLTDAIFTAPVVAEGRVYVVDGAGVAFCLDAATLRVLWKVATRGGGRNCNNVSSPALAGRYLHFGTMAGVYYVLDAATGKIVRQIACGEPIFSTPVVGNDRVYFATLGSQVYALKPDGQVCLEMGLRPPAAGLHRRPLERRRVGPAPQGPRDQQRAVPLLARHRPGRPHAGHSGRRLAGLARRPRPTSQSPPAALPSTRPRSA